MGCTYDPLVLANRLLPIFRKTELAAQGLRIGSKQCCHAISQQQYTPEISLVNQLNILQRWSRGHKARGQGQGHKKNPRPRTAFPRTDTLEAKAKDQGHKRKCSPKKKERSSQKFFRRSQKKKKVFSKIFQAISTKNVFQKIFQALHKILTNQKIVLSSSRGQANFRGLEASRPRT